jgi:inner membrane protein
MNGKTHQLVGITGGFLTSAILVRSGSFEIADAAAAIVGSSIGSYIPDVDHIFSVAGRKAFFLSWPILGLHKLFKWIYSKTKIKFFKKLSDMFNHRGIFHAPLFWTVIFLPLFFLATSLIKDEFIKNTLVGFLFGNFIGVFLHLFADMLNPTGIPIFMPFHDKKYRLAQIRTGSWGEFIFRIIMVVVFVVVAFVSFLIMGGGVL